MEENKSEERKQQEQLLREQLNAEAEQKVPEKIEKKGTEKVIDSYKDKWGIKDDDKYYVSNNKSSKRKNFPHDAEIGDEWEDPKSGKIFIKNGENSWSQKGRKNRFNPKRCGNCDRWLSNQNEINVNLSTGQCYKCHAIEEKLKIAKGEEYEPPSWKKEIMFTDTMGRPIMNIYEVIEEYGQMVGHGVLTQLIGGMEKMKEEGKKINKPMLKNAKKIKKELEEKIGVIDHSKIREQMIELKNQMNDKKNKKLKKNYDLSEK